MESQTLSMFVWTGQSELFMMGQNSLKGGIVGFLWLAHWIITPALIELNIIFNFTLNMDNLVFIALLKLAYKHFSGRTDDSRLQKETIFYFS